MDRRDPPPTDEGWYALHDLRTVDWDAWSDAPERARDRAVAEGVAYLESHVAVEDADAGESAVFAVLGHDADLMILHLRPTMADLDAATRRFESTELARFTDRADSYVSVTEASGYTEKAREYFEGDLDEDSGLYQYIQSRLYPEIPDAEHVSFYPMSKRRGPDHNWYDLPFEERAELMAGHGDIGRGYAGKVEQIITGSTGFDDWEWGVTLFADDPAHIKDLVYEMRFDPSSSRYAEFGPFYVGRRFPPADLGALLAGQEVPTGDEEAGGRHRSVPGSRAGTPESGSRRVAAGRAGAAPARGRGQGGAGDVEGHGGPHPGSPGEGDHPHGSDGADADAVDHPTSGGSATSDGDDEDDGGGSDGDESDAGGPPASGGAEVEEEPDIERRLATLGVRAGEDYGDGDYGLVFPSEADAADLADEVDRLRGNFDHYDTHVMTGVRAQGGRAHVVSVWANERAADTAAGFLSDLPGVTDGVGGTLGDPDAAGSGEAAATDAGAGGEGEGASGSESESEPPAETDDEIRGELADLDIYAGQPRGEDVYAMVLYSTADPDDLAEEVYGLRERFAEYDTHVKTAVYEAREGDRTAVVSLWETQSAADTAGKFLSDLPGIVERAGEGSGFGTMGMFYTVEPEHRGDFVEKFAAVGDLLADMDGHHDTALLENREDENDMFIASNWRSKDDAMAFFRSDEFSETVSWGREVLADRPRHVFLA